MEFLSHLGPMRSEKDGQSVVISCNEAFLAYAGLGSLDQAIGYSDYDFVWERYADIYRKHELDALAGNNYSTIYPVIDYAGNNRLLSDNHKYLWTTVKIPHGFMVFLGLVFLLYVGKIGVVYDVYKSTGKRTYEKFIKP